MAEPKAPLLSLGARGSLGDTLTFQKRGTGTMVRSKPTPTDPQTIRQILHRWLYRHYSEAWHLLSSAQQFQWRRGATPYHMTGFNFFMRDQLRHLPDLAVRYPMLETSGPSLFDLSANTNNATIFGALWNNLPPFLSYLSFDGTDDYTSAPDTPSLDNILCFECWFCAPVEVAHATVFHIIQSKHANWRHALGIHYTVSPNALTVVFFDGVALSRAITNIPAYNQWLHLVGQFETDMRAHLYINGVHIAQGIVITGTEGVNTAPYRQLGGLVNRYTRGYLSYPRAYNEPLDPVLIALHNELERPFLIPPP